MTARCIGLTNVVECVRTAEKIVIQFVIVRAFYPLLLLVSFAIQMIKVFPPLEELQEEQASVKLSVVCVPPLMSGTT